MFRKGSSSLSPPKNPQESAHYYIFSGINEDKANSREFYFDDEERLSFVVSPENFSTVSSFQNMKYKMTTQQTFEQSVPAAANAAQSFWKRRSAGLLILLALRIEFSRYKRLNRASFKKSSGTNSLFVSLLFLGS